MRLPIAKVHRDQLATFLKENGRYWTVEAFPPFLVHVAHIPLSTDELIDAIGAYAPQTEFVYVFSDDDTPFDLVKANGIESAPTIDSAGLADYIIGSVRGGDFLWISPDDESASSANYITLMRHNGPEEINVTEEPGPILSGMSITRFKGISRQVDIQFAPITLLFGANSAGKSTVIHAIHYAREILVRKNLDVDRTAIGGNQIELGGFTNLRHDRDVEQDVRLRFQLDLRGVDLPDYLPNRGDLLPSDLNVLEPVSKPS